MGLWDAVSRFFALEPLQERTVVDPFTAAPDMDTQLANLRIWQATARPWRAPSITEALGVPAIQRAVTLISNTSGSLSVQGFRNGAAMDVPPRIVARPDPYSTPRDFYRDSTFNMATRGEVVWWIASRDSLEQPTALIVVPLAELSVENNTRNRLFPIYTWGSVKSTRYSAANRDGQFVHVTYLKEPGALRGVGPLQMAGAAASVSVEAQEWAANFYASGGYPSMLLKSDLDLSPAEATALKTAWTETPSNMPKVLSGEGLEAQEFNANPQGAQMLEAREHQNGDAARMFGIPGSLLEYGAPGSSLTYQNLAEVWNQFVKGCLAPNYLEPMEQALTDLLPRAQTARFHVEGLLRADIKTRYEVYGMGITAGILTSEDAQRMEGLIPGNVEVAATPQSPPAAVPASLPYERSGAVRCDGRHPKNRNLVCNRLLAEQGPFVGTCPRCKKVYAATAEPHADRFADLLAAVTTLVMREQPAPIVNPPAVNVTIERGAVEAPISVTTPDVHVESPITVHQPAPEAPVMKLYQAGTEADTELAARMAVTLDAIERELKRPRAVDKEVIRDAKGVIVGVREIETRTEEHIDG